MSTEPRSSAEPIVGTTDAELAPPVANSGWEYSLAQAASLIEKILPGPGSHLRLLTLPGAPGDDEPRFCDDLAETDSSDAATLVRAANGRGFAVLALPHPPQQGGEAGSRAPTSIVLVSDTPRSWTSADRVFLADIAVILATELGLHREIDDRRAVEEELRLNALRDSLTGLPNSTLFLDRLAHAIERARRHTDFRFAVLALDLDRFKGINNSLGRDIGDDVLVAVARRLESCVRGEDMVARAGGDEFAILLESLSDDSDGSRVAERMLRSLSLEIATPEGDVYTSASVGIVLSSSGLAPPSTLLQQAGIAMSRAKTAGRSRAEMFDSAMHARARTRLRMETDLRHAIDRNEFEVYYQPLITLGSGRITELEALVRWRHPERGTVPPLDFIPLAEETGMIVPIGGWVLANACRQMREWQQRFPRTNALSLSVNLSPKQFAQPDFVKFVSDTVAASGLDPRSLKLEITESFAIDDPELTRTLLAALRSLGIQIYLDDFGTGYSSLAYLHQLPLDGIKIDRSFVTRMDTGPLYRQLVHTVRDLALNIGVIAVAEGVETNSQLEAIRALGCESAQGYLFSRPVPRDRIEQLLTADPRW